MQKDVIYIDTEDDITGIISKIKASEGKVIALVPPKRVGTLQSAVNLRLLQRAASLKHKHLVLITSNNALSLLAGSANIPVAKTLQSKPEVKTADTNEEDEDEIIEGIVTTPEEPPKKAKKLTHTTAAAVMEDVEVEGDIATDDEPKKAEKPKKPVTIPNFSTFRKRLFIGGIIALLLIGFLVWANAYAPNAKIIVHMKSSESALSQRVTITSTGATNAKELTIKGVKKSAKKDISVPVVATGKKDVGEKARGLVTISNSTFDAVTLASGTKLTTSGGLAFLIEKGITVPGAQCRGSLRGCSEGTAKTSVIAGTAGTNYNAATGNLTGASSDIAITLAGPTGGGTDKTVSVATQGDIDTAMKQVSASKDEEAQKATLSKQFDGNSIALPESFTVEMGAVKPNIAVDQEIPAGTSPAIVGAAEYTMTGVDKRELETYLSAIFNQKIEGQKNQKVYNNGVDTVKFANISSSNGTIQAGLTARGAIGPKLTEEEVLKIAYKKQIGEVQAQLKVFEGVSNVDVKLSPFWVSTVPNDPKKVTVEFKVDGK